MTLNFAGCSHFWDVWNRPLTIWNVTPEPPNADPTPYRHWASQIDYPDAHSAPHNPELFAAEPRRLRNVTKDEIWDMPLQQAIRIALSNSRVIRSSGQFLNPGNPVLNNAQFVPSSLDPAIQESGVLFGQRGIEGALSEFDAQFTTTMVWGRDEAIQNSSFGTGVTAGAEQVQETANFSTGITKRLASGGVIGVLHDWNYLGSNSNEFIPGGRLFPSSYTGRVRGEFRQPLLAGAGTEYTRIAGPITEQIQGVTGVQQGVVIARINNDIELTEFEGSIRDLMRDVETLYWRLYLTYQQFASEKALYEEAVETFRDIDALLEAESQYAGALERTEAVEFVYQLQARVTSAHDNMIDVEAQLRRLIGLTVNDGRIIRPIDEPITAGFSPDWYSMLGEALSRRVELRRQKWRIKQLELQLKAAEHLIKPRLDFVAGYQVNGFGDQLLGSNVDAVTGRFGNAYRSISNGDQTGWNLGLEFSMPFGLRFAHSQARNLELQIAKARETLEAAEIEVSHELADTFRELDRAYLAMENSYNRKRQGKIRVESVLALNRQQPERYTEDAIFRARDQLAQVEAQYLQAVIEYNIAIMEVHYRGGQLLSMNNVHLSEGPWDEEAEYDVLDRGYDRWHSLPTQTMLHHAPAPLAHPGGTVPQPPHATGQFGPAAEGWMTDDAIVEPQPDGDGVNGNRLNTVPMAPPAMSPDLQTPPPSGNPPPDAPEPKNLDDLVEGGPILQIGESLDPHRSRIPSADRVGEEMRQQSPNRLNTPQDAKRLDPTGRPDIPERAKSVEVPVIRQVDARQRDGVEEVWQLTPPNKPLKK